MNKKVRNIVIMASVLAGAIIPSFAFDKCIVAQAATPPYESDCKESQIENVELDEENSCILPEKPSKFDISTLSGEYRFVGWQIKKDSSVSVQGQIDDDTLVYGFDGAGDLVALQDIYKPNSKITLSENTEVQIIPVYARNVAVFNGYIDVYLRYYSDSGAYMSDSEIQSYVIDKLNAQDKQIHDYAISKNYTMGLVADVRSWYPYPFWISNVQTNYSLIYNATVLFVDKNDSNANIVSESYSQCYGKKLFYNPLKNIVEKSIPDVQHEGGKWMYYDAAIGKLVDLSEDDINNFTFAANSNKQILIWDIFPENVTYNIVEGDAVKQTVTQKVEHDEQPDVLDAESKFTIPSDSYIQWDSEPKLKWYKNCSGIGPDSITTVNGEIKPYNIVKFEDENGTEIKTIKLKQGESLNEADIPDAPDKEGYTFSNWDRNLTDIAGSLEVKPIYNINKYRVTVDGKEQMVDYGSDVVLPNDPEKEGYTFTGWEGQTTNIKADGAVTSKFAINNYKVEFKDYDGSTLDVQNINYRDAATRPSDPQREGYTFTGWDSDFDSITGNLEVNAQYTINKYTVTVDGKSQTVDYGSDVVLPNDPEKEGYTFTGWDKSFDSIEGPLVVTAQYKINTFKVTVDGVDQSVNYGGNVVLPQNPTKTGYYFAGWKGETSNITKDGIVTPIFERIVNKVTFIDGQNKTVVDVNYGDSIEPPAPKIPEGYDFLGWKDASNLQNVISDKVVEAQYAKKSFSVNVNGTIQNVLYGDSVIMPGNPEKEGYTFKGWNGQTTNISSNGIVINPIFEINKYKVEFKDYDGTILNTQNVEYKKAATKPVDPKREGYVFKGWDKTFDIITGNLEVNALYEKEKHTIQIIVNGSVETKEVEDDVDIETILPKNPQKKGYTFAGWKTTVDPKTNLKTLVADFKINQYVIAYKMVTGEVITTQVVNYNDSATLPKAPEIKGYKFVGWSSPLDNVTKDMEVYPIYEKIDNDSDINNQIDNSNDKDALTSKNDQNTSINDSETVQLATNTIENSNNAESKISAGSSVKKTADNKAVVPVIGILISLFICTINFLKKIMKHNI